MSTTRRRHNPDANREHPLDAKLEEIWARGFPELYRDHPDRKGN